MEEFVKIKANLIAKDETRWDSGPLVLRRRRKKERKYIYIYIYC